MHDFFVGRKHSCMLEKVAPTRGFSLAKKISVCEEKIVFYTTFFIGKKKNRNK
jgi:hypothetical protein